MSHTRLSGLLLLFGATILPLNFAAAQRPKPVSDSKPAAPAPAPRPAEPRPAPRPVATPTPAAPAPRPQPAPQPRPSQPHNNPRPSFPQPTPAEPPRSTPRPRDDFPRSSPRPSEPYQPSSPRSQPQPLPGNTPGRGQPRSFPRPSDDAPRQPGASQPRPIGNGEPAQPGRPRAVGGTVRVVERDGKSPPSGDKPAGNGDRPLKPRDLYDDTIARPKPNTPNPKPRAGSDHPTTTRSLADRYRSEPRPRSDAEPLPQPRGVDGKAATPQPRGGSRVALVDRYDGALRRRGGNVAAAPGDAVAPRPSPRPTLNPRAPAGPRGGIAVPPATSPRLVARPRTTTSVLSRSLGHTGSCFGPVWDPCWSWSSNWNSHCSPGLTWCLGINSGSFCWGWSSWLPLHCYRRAHWCAPTYLNVWWDPCYRSCYSPVWWPSYWSPTYVYTYAEPSTVVYVETENSGDETIVVNGGTRELPPAERARRYLDLGDFYFRDGRFKEAADAYAKARALVPDDASIHFVLADAQFALGDYHFAAYLINEALRLDPSLALADTDKRLLYGNPAVFEKQIATLVRYLDEKPYDAMAHLVLGYNLKFSDQPKDAEKALRRVLEIDPGSIAAKLLLDAVLAPKPAVAPAAPAEAKAPAAGGEKVEKTDR